MRNRRNFGFNGRTVDLSPRPRHPKDRRPPMPMPFDLALRKFKKMVEKSGVLKDLRSKEFYEKPCQKRIRKKNEAERRWKKKVVASMPQPRRRSRLVK
jgi:small subunit ribosomal protein S21